MNKLEYIKILKQNAKDFTSLTCYNIKQLEGIDNEEFMMNIAEYLAVFPASKAVRDRIIELEERTYNQQKKICELSNKVSAVNSALFISQEKIKRLKAQAGADLLTVYEITQERNAENNSIKKVLEGKLAQQKDENRILSEKLKEANENKEQAAFMLEALKEVINFGINTINQEKLWKRS